MPYLSVNAISDAIDHIATTYPALTQIIALPEPSSGWFRTPTS